MGGCNMGARRVRGRGAPVTSIGHSVDERYRALESGNETKMSLLLISQVEVAFFAISKGTRALAVPEMASVLTWARQDDLGPNVVGMLVSLRYLSPKPLLQLLLLKSHQMVISDYVANGLKSPISFVFHLTC